MKRNGIKLINSTNLHNNLDFYFNYIVTSVRRKNKHFHNYLNVLVLLNTFPYSYTININNRGRFSSNRIHITLQIS